MNGVQRLSEILSNDKVNLFSDKGKENTIMTGYKQLDDILGGMDSGSLIVLGGRTAMGKSAFAINIANNNAVQGTPVLFVSLESTYDTLVSKFVSCSTKIDFSCIRGRKLAPEDWEKLDKELKNIKDLPLYLDCRSIGKIDELCDDITKAVNNNNIKIVIIDYLQLLYTEVSAPDDNRYGDINYFTRRLKSLAKELNIPILLISQLNRNVEIGKSGYGVDSFLPKLTDLRDSGTICDDSDVVIFIYRPEYYHFYEDEKGNDMRGMAEIIVAKNRLGSTGQYLLHCNLKKISFSDDSIVSDNPGMYAFSAENK